MNGLQELAVRYKFHRMMPLGIDDKDFSRLASLTGVSENEIRKAHESFTEIGLMEKRQNITNHQTLLIWESELFTRSLITFLI